MTSLTLFLKYEILLIVAVFIAVVIYKMLSGKINTQKLLYDKNSRTLSSARVQQFVFTIIISFYYLYLSIKNPSSFPIIDESLLYLLTGSSLVYLGGKARSIRWFIKKFIK